MIGGSLRSSNHSEMRNLPPVLWLMATLNPRQGLGLRDLLHKFIDLDPALVSKAIIRRACCKDAVDQVAALEFRAGKNVAPLLVVQLFRIAEALPEDELDRLGEGRRQIIFRIFICSCEQRSCCP